MKKILLIIVTSIDFSYKPLFGQNAAVGSGHFHVVCNDGSLESWGVNTDGEFGDGTFANSNSPVAATSISNIISVKAGSSHCVALRNDGTVWTWGGNSVGQLGDGTHNRSNVPINVAALSGIVAIDANSDHSVALRNDGTVWLWGNVIYGNGSTASATAPVQASITGVIAIAAGGLYTLALKNDGTVWAWGRNQNGFLGTGTLADSYVPVQVNGLTNIVAISASSHSFALRNDGSLWAWGWNNNGQLGDGTINSTGCFCKPSPVLTPLSNVKSIRAGAGHSLALKNDGTVWAWGYNLWGQLGIGNNNNSATPSMLTSLSSVNGVEAAFYSSLAIKSDGSAWTWGAYGNQTTGDTTNSPFMIIGLCQAGTSNEGHSGKRIPARAFPNPATKQVSIDTGTQEWCRIIVRNSSGQEVYAEVAKVRYKVINVGPFPKGFYYIELIPLNGNEGSKVIKLVIE